ncbi:hypothetical protein SPSYN_02439 [Sporotomaculum syntrophicum]|uniref:Uncharacterized protein n=1 Tax=Sporotomaculum syntrophicum TaxID=182264 RepID=A0A9D2WPQ8_9FIRM|nr:hypothetical protein SPSYN_02439 [Sporotomaculum syntrophicum]
MFFGSWWQGIVFGIVTSIAMASLCYAFALKWSKFTGELKKPSPSHDAHH